jgi:hypothetical protein
MSIVLPYQGALVGGLSSGHLKLGFLSVMGPLEQAGFQKWSCERSEQSTKLSIYRQAHELEMSFSLGETVSISLLLVSLRQCSYLAFPTVATL